VTRPRVDPVIVLRRLRRELEESVRLLEAMHRRSDRDQGQLEALRYVQTVIRNEARP
jgi:hypothetical protein